MGPQPWRSGCLTVASCSRWSVWTRREPSLFLFSRDHTQLLAQVLVTPRERQWAHSRDLLLVHPEKQTDSFILYIKGTIMICKYSFFRFGALKVERIAASHFAFFWLAGDSRCKCGASTKCAHFWAPLIIESPTHASGYAAHVKTFNLRFRARHFAGDASVTSSYNDSTEPIDPRGSQAFIELDHIVSSFRASFPSHLRNPITDNVVDNHLYTACLMPHVWVMINTLPYNRIINLPNVALQRNDRVTWSTRRCTTIRLYFCSQDSDRGSCHPRPNI